MARLEYKYNIPLEYLDDLRKDVMPYLVYDHFTLKREKKEYTVRSIYLDTHELLTYNEKLDGVKVRNKYRIRGYNEQEEDSIVFIEIKRKDVDYVSKDRAPLHYNDLERFLKTKDLSLIQATGNDLLKRKSSAQNFLFYFTYKVLKPAVLINYEREAFECKFGSGLRVTFDKNVRTCAVNSYSELFTTKKLIPSLKKYFVLEVKFHQILPNWLPIIMKKYNIIRESVPKYALSIEAADKNSIFKSKYRN